MFSDLIYISIVSLENPLDHAEKCIYMNNVTISKIKERTFCKTDREFVEFCISLLKKYRADRPKTCLDMMQMAWVDTS